MCLARGASSTSTFNFVFDVYFTNIDRPPARGASSSTSSTSNFNFLFGVYFTDIDKPVARGASSSTSSTSTFSFVFGVYFTDIDRTPARGASSSTCRRPLSTPSSASTSLTSTGLRFERLRRPPHRHRLSTLSSLSTSSTVTPASLYQHVLHRTQCTALGLHHNHRTRGDMVASG
jgi:hypothetical protein